MDIELPKFFRQETSQGSASSDFTNDLIIHRIKVSTGLGGPITYRIDIDGIDQYDKKTIDVAPNVYNFNNVNLSANAIHDVPLYQRNENLKSTLLAIHRSLSGLLAMNWEGRVIIDSTHDPNYEDKYRPSTLSDIAPIVGDLLDSGC